MDNTIKMSCSNIWEWTVLRKMRITVVMVVVGCIGSTTPSMFTSRGADCEVPRNIPHGSVQVLLKGTIIENAQRKGEDEDILPWSSRVRQQRREGVEERFAEGSVAEYSCDHGYCLHPPTRGTLTCRQSSWVGMLPRCVHKSQLEEEAISPSPSRAMTLLGKRNGIRRNPIISSSSLLEEVQSNMLANRSIFCVTHALPHLQQPTPLPQNQLYGFAVTRTCTRPDAELNGYYIEVAGSTDPTYESGSRLQFVCHTGYILRGPDVFTCDKTGEWKPRHRPQCQPSHQLLGSDICPVAPDIKNTVQKLVRGVVTAYGAIRGTKIEYRCREGYRNVLAPCVTHTLTCHQEQWHGTSPECEEFSSCVAPPNIAHGFMYDRASSYPLQSEVYYSCEAGYRLMGPSVLTCEDTGCWTPKLPPMCQHIHQYEDELQDENSMPDMHTVLVTTTGSVIGVLLIVLALVLYQRAVSPKLVRLRNSGSGGELPQQSCPPNIPQPPQDHDPDRVALIAYSDEGVPPTYEEAVRQRPAIMFEPHGGSSGRYPPHAHRNRGHRVVVPGVRRSRHRDNPDNISYQSIGSARQSSSWSACDSLGSTDTVAVSDSTNVTVETQSSGGASTSAASQTPSCRALAGSLVSVDTSSLMNNEGAPLLEEAEVDETFEQQRAEDQYSLSTRDSDSLKDNVSHTRSVTVSLQE